MRLSIEGGKLVQDDGTVLGEVGHITFDFEPAPRARARNSALDVSVDTDVPEGLTTPKEEKLSLLEGPGNFLEMESQTALLPDPIDETWQVYVEALERPRAVLTPKVRRWIKDAHAAVGVDETQKAIRGLAASDYHRTKGYVGIEYAIRPRQNETIEGRIAMMAAHAPEAPTSNGLLSVEQLVNRFDAESRDMVWAWIDDINRWALRPNIENTKAQADRQLARLRHNGYEAVIESGRVVGARTIV